MISRLAVAAFAMLAALPARAGDADVTDVVIRQRDGLYDLDVTIRSNDTGWERYADRIEAILASHIENFRDSVIARKAYSPHDLETMNINLVGGDPYGGYCGIDQFFLWRPFHSSVNHRTPVARLYHIGASTHPGPGLGGGSGFLLANSL